MKRIPIANVSGIFYFMRVLKKEPENDMFSGSFVVLLICKVMLILKTKPIRFNRFFILISR